MAQLPKLFLSRKLYGTRLWHHLALFEQRDVKGWWFVQVGSWTLEVTL